MKVCVIGGGPSGMMAAISSARKGNNVTIIEHNSRLGKKILSTGAGRCNLSNTDQSIIHYHGKASLINNVFSSFSMTDTLNFLSNYGLYTCEKNGYIYPYNEMASSVLDILEKAVAKEKVNVLLNSDITNIEILSDKKSNFKITYKLEGKDLSAYYDRLIICTGSKAAPKTGSDGSGYELSKKLGHTITPILPALCGLRAREDYFKSLKGIRCKAKTSLYINNQFVKEEHGEVQFNDYGISGICVMQLSFLASKALYENKKVRINISFLPGLTKREIYELLNTRVNLSPESEAKDLLNSIVHINIAKLLIKKAGIKMELKYKDISQKSIEMLSDYLDSFPIDIKSTNSFEDSQVCAGGINLNEVNDDLSSKIVNNLYFAGEILDVNGDCGGYNLQWAFSSGFVAGNN